MLNLAISLPFQFLTTQIMTNYSSHKTKIVQVFQLTRLFSHSWVVLSSKLQVEVKCARTSFCIVGQCDQFLMV